MAETKKKDSRSRKKYALDVHYVCEKITAVNDAISALRGYDVFKSKKEVAVEVDRFKTDICKAYKVDRDYIEKIIDGR